MATSSGVAAKVAGTSSGWARDGLATAIGAELLFQALVDDAFVRGVHVHQHQALGVFGQDVDAVQLGNGAAQGPDGWCVPVAGWVVGGHRALLRVLRPLRGLPLYLRKTLCPPTTKGVGDAGAGPP